MLRLRLATRAAAAVATGLTARTLCQGTNWSREPTDWSCPKKARAVESNYKTPEVVAQRAMMIEMLKPAAGERCLDIGCGPGFMMRDLADAVGPQGRVDGIDLSEPMCELARARLSTAAAPVELRLGGAEELPYADSTFDAVVLSQVLLYVHDVPKALREVRRVLRPGGRLLIVDTDWDSLVVHTADKARLERIRTVCCSTFVDAHLPPKLPGLLAAGGLPITELKTQPMIGAGTAERDGGSFVGNWAFRVAVDKAHKCGLPESDVAGWLDEQHALSEAGAFFVCVHRFLFLAHKPR